MKKKNYRAINLFVLIIWIPFTIGVCFLAYGIVEEVFFNPEHDFEKRYYAISGRLGHSILAILFAIGAIGMIKSLYDLILAVATGKKLKDQD
tara:strand:+ start:556 stop:831 length:276 start_codon:yes stop_codon:yes gene_type:complete